MNPARKKLVLPVLALLSSSVLSPVLANADDVSEGRSDSQSAERSQNTARKFKRFGLTVGLGYGFSIPSSDLASLALFKPSNSDFADYLAALDLEFSENIVTTSLQASFGITRNLVLSYYTVYGFVDQPVSETLPGLRDQDSGQGDSEISLAYILEEQKRRPQIIISAALNDDSAEFSSLGDGLKGRRISLRASKFINDRVYGIGGLGVTTRDNKNGVEPGDINSVTLGFGFLTQKASTKVEFALQQYSIDPSILPDGGRFDGSDNISLIASFQGASEKLGMQFYITGLKDFEAETSTMGARFTYSF